MEKVKKGDFIEISFIGRIKGNNQIFDLTEEEVAKKNNLHNPNFKYGPRRICVGENHIIRGLDEKLIDKEVGRSYILEIDMDEAFGRKDSKLVKIMNLQNFKDKGVNPFPGLQITADNRLGTIRSVAGGRVVVDFNHPLSGKDLVYEITILRKIEDNLKKLKILILNELGIQKEKYKINDKGGIYEINIKENISLPEEIKNKFIEKVKRLIPAMNIKFVIGSKKDIEE